VGAEPSTHSTPRKCRYECTQHSVQLLPPSVKPAGKSGAERSCSGWRWWHVPVPEGTGQQVYQQAAKRSRVLPGCLFNGPGHGLPARLCNRMTLRSASCGHLQVDTAPTLACACCQPAASASNPLKRRAGEHCSPPKSWHDTPVPQCLGVSLPPPPLLLPAAPRMRRSPCPLGHLPPNTGASPYSPTDPPVQSLTQLFR
jgi:hypothetical protein